MKKFIVYLFFLNLSCGLFAQNANYEQAEKAKSNRLPWNSDQLTPFFTQGSDDFWFREVKEGEEKYYYVDLKARKVEKLWDPRGKRSFGIYFFRGKKCRRDPFQRT